MIPLPKDFVNHFFLHSGIFVILVIVFVTLIVDFCVIKAVLFHSVNIGLAGIAVVTLKFLFIPFLSLRMVMGITVITI